MRKLSTGDTEVKLSYHGRGDEIGRMIEAIEIFRRNALEIQDMQLSRREAEEQRTQKRREEMSAFAEEFEGSVKHIAGQLVEAVTAVKTNAEAMAKAAEHTRTKSGSTVEAVVEFAGERGNGRAGGAASCRAPSTNWRGEPATSSSSPTTPRNNRKAPAPNWRSSPPRSSRYCRSPI